MINIIVAVGKNNEIGLNGKMLWYIPSELKHFKNTTINHKVVMGRITFEAIGEPLKNRENIVITNNKNYGKNKNIIIYHSIYEVIEKYKNSEENIFIIGGESIYKEFIEYADKIYISYINKEYIADKYFPKFDERKYEIIKEEKYEEYIFKIFKRRINE